MDGKGEGTEGGSAELSIVAMMKTRNKYRINGTN